MKNASLLKIIMCLFIMGVYVFMFGIMGTVQGTQQLILPEETVSSPDTEAPDEETSAEEQTTSEEQTMLTAPEDGFVYGTTLNVENAAKPLMGDYSQQQSASRYPSDTEEEEETADTTEETTESTPDFVVEDSDYTTEATTASPVTTTEQTTAAEITTEEQTTEPTTEQTTEETTTQAPAASNEQLTVYYTGSGGNVTGDAIDILSQVVMGEIGGQFDPEAIKAQAVAAYTYIKYYNINDSVPYVAVRTPNQTVIDCVTEVIGQLLYYDGTIIQSVYSASTAGYTASSKNVWGVDYPYLQSKYCELDSLYDPNYGLEKTMTSEEVRNTVYTNTGISLSGDPSDWFTIENYVDTVFVGDMTIGGQSTYTSGGKTVYITGRSFREKVMGYKLRSACFEIDYNPSSDTFTFTTYGYGHCVGFSQHGANLLATYWDYDYKQILDYYFPGTEIRY